MRWRELSACPLSLEHTQSIALPDGRVLQNGEGGAFLLDPVADRWEQTHPSLLARDRGLAITAEGWLLACGGVKGAWLQDGCELFRPESSSWHPMPPLPAPVAHVSCATVRGRVFAIGGFERGASGGGFASKTTLSWAPGETAWQRHPDAPFATEHESVPLLVLADDSIVFAYRAELARFDGEWTGLDGGIDGAALAGLPEGGFVVAGGGASRSEALAGVRAWHDGWGHRPALPRPRKRAHAVRLGDRIAILGGYWTEASWEDVHDVGEIDVPASSYMERVVHDHAHADALVTLGDVWQIVPAPPITGACHALDDHRVIVMAPRPLLFDFEDA